MTLDTILLAVASIDEGSVNQRDPQTWLPCSPADAQLTGCANYVVASLRLQDWNAASRAVHGFVVSNHGLDRCSGLSIFSLASTVGVDFVLVLLAVLALVDRFASDAIDDLAHFARKAAKVGVSFNESSTIR